MTDKELAKEAFEYRKELVPYTELGYPDVAIPVYEALDIDRAYFAGAKKYAQQWHKIFTDSTPYNYEYWDLPQETLPQIQNFYFVKLKNGFIKICELKYDVHSKKKCFYDLHGGKQSNVAEWLDYPKE